MRQRTRKRKSGRAAALVAWLASRANPDLVKYEWEYIVGPRWFGYLIVSTVAVTGVLVGRALTLGRPITGTIAVIILVVNVIILVKHLWWMFDVIEDNAYSRGQRDTLDRVMQEAEERVSE